jgi:hypothetical protein
VPGLLKLPVLMEWITIVMALLIAKNLAAQAKLVQAEFDAAKTQGTASNRNAELRAAIAMCAAQLQGRCAMPQSALLGNIVKRQQAYARLLMNQAVCA